MKTTCHTHQISSQSPPIFVFILNISFFALFVKLSSSNSDTLISSSLLFQNETLLSKNGLFEFGFFSRSNNWYLGTWFKQIPDQTVVWVANRDCPLTQPPGAFGMFGEALVLLDKTNNSVWSSGNMPVIQPVVQLLDSGNLVLREGKRKTSTVLWQSFDYPTNTLLSGMKLGKDRKRGLDWHLTSWKNMNDPSTGDYCFLLDIKGVPEMRMHHNNLTSYRSGPWDGIGFIGFPEMKPLNFVNFSFVVKNDAVFYSYHIFDASFFSILTVTPSGELQRYAWNAKKQEWVSFWYVPKDQCDNYGECGPNGICDSNDWPICNCLPGFRPKQPALWSLGITPDGCVRKTKMEGEKDQFLHLKNFKLPESSKSVNVPNSAALSDCQSMCLKNSSCTAIARSSKLHGGSGCLLWFDELLDMRHYSNGGEDLYVKLAAVDVVGTDASKNVLSFCLEISSILFFIGFCAFLVWKRSRIMLTCEGKNQAFTKRSGSLPREMSLPSKGDHRCEKNMDEVELPLFDFSTITMATNNFSDENKLGQGGFGSVYKGMLADGRLIAAKKLADNSGGGIEEFKNEIKLIARLQHRNLVRLLGCCTDMSQKILIYEFMQHRSLDSILFDAEKSSLLDWERRVKIIFGIARGVQYLHLDSRYRIIHRDLTASNVLLDEEWNPKISDFGLARIFGDVMESTNTCRVVGTFGYMSPEYALDGTFSVKSDVFSFGVLVLEIISGKKNRGFYGLNISSSLIGYAWSLWKEGNASQLLDPSIDGSSSSVEVKRYVQVGLLCVEERAEDRPTMLSVNLMLSSGTSILPEPKSPACFLRQNVKNDCDSGLGSEQEEKESQVAQV